MASLSAKLTCVFLTAISIVGMGFTPMIHGDDAAAGCYTSTSCEDCCTPEPTCGADATADQTLSDCCSTSGEEEDCPCSCPCCAGSSVVSRTINLISNESPTPLLLASNAERFAPKPDREPVSVSLGVDIQPPII